MKNFRSAAFAAALLCAVSSSAAIAGSLTTTFSTGNSGRQGMYLDLTATNALTISNFVVNRMYSCLRCENCSIASSIM